MGLKSELMHMVFRVQGEAAGAVETLPEPVKKLLLRALGEDARLVNADDAMKILVSVNALIGQPLISKNYKLSRTFFDKQMQFTRSQAISLHQVVDFTLPSTQDTHEIPVRHYVPKVPVAADSREPILVYFHGGGFVIGNLDTHDEFCRYLSLYADMQVLSVDYRLAPEHPAPAAVLDCLDALSWVHEHAERLGIDTDAICVGGDSAGGNLAAVVAQQSKHLPYAPAAQLLIYPLTDAVKSYTSHQQYGEGLTLTLQDKHLFEYFYIHQGALKPDDVLISPVYGDVQGVAPAYVVTAEADILVDEGEAYAYQLRQAGVPVYSERVYGQPHGFINMINLHARAKLEVIKLAQGFAAFLHEHTE